MPSFTYPGLVFFLNERKTEEILTACENTNYHYYVEDRFSVVLAIFKGAFQHCEAAHKDWLRSFLFEEENIVSPATSLPLQTCSLSAVSAWQI